MFLKFITIICFFLVRIESFRHFSLSKCNIRKDSIRKSLLPLEHKTIVRKMSLNLDQDNDLDYIKEGFTNETNIFIISSIALLLATAFQSLQHNFDLSLFIQNAVNNISSMGSLGYLYFASIYVLAELLAIPAFPLTASSGYLFGLFPGFLVVLGSATVASGISFLIGRTFLREWAQKLATKYLGEKWQKIDSAIAKEGFRVVLLLRLSPLLPFALSNYLYGLTSVSFYEFITATFLGFSPGTFGIVYAGSVGKDVFTGVDSLPWYFYLGGGLIIALIGQTITKVASQAVNEMSNNNDTALPKF